MERLKVLRETKGLSQAQLAVMADMNPTTLWRYETGQRSPTIEQLERLAEVLDAEVVDFFPKAGAPPTPHESSWIDVGEQYRTQLCELIEAWQESKDRGDDYATRSKHLEAINHFLNASCQGERAMFYEDFLEAVAGAGLSIHVRHLDGSTSPLTHTVEPALSA